MSLKDRWRKWKQKNQLLDNLRNRRFCELTEEAEDRKSGNNSLSSEH